MSTPLFDPRALAHNQARAARHRDTHGFLNDWVQKDIDARLELIKRDFVETLRIGPDEEDSKLPDQTAQHDSIFSVLNLHSSPDLPGVLQRINLALKPDGLFIGALFGGETLHELRACLMQAELAVTGGVSPRILPFATKQQMGALLQRAGFALPAVDSDILTVTYSDAYALMRDLRFMGESNVMAARNKAYAGRALFAETDRLYKEQFAEEDGRIRASFEIIFLIGWAPHDSQQKPLRPGSAEKSLSDVLER